MVDKSGLLFCLANADLLDYDVSQQAVRALEYLTQGESSKFITIGTIIVLGCGLTI